MGVPLYPELQYTLEEDLTPEAFSGDDIDAICTEISEACAGWGTDEDRLLKAMGTLTHETRCKIPYRYKEMFDKDLNTVMKKECGNKAFGTALQFLGATPLEAECMMIDEACSGAGTAEKVVASIIIGRTNKELEMLKKKFYDMYSKDLGQVVASEISGNLEKLMLNVMQGDVEEYDEDYHTDEKMAEDAKAIYEDAQGERGTDEVALFKLLCRSPPEYLQRLNLHYAQEYGYTLPKVLEKELGGTLDFAGVFMIEMKLKPYEAIASVVDEACAGFGTNELLLTTALMRYQSIMKEVQAAHQEKYEKSIEERIESEVGGDYKKILQEILTTGMSL